MNKTIAEQLRAAGFKESPVAVVGRLYERHQRMKKKGCKVPENRRLWDSILASLKGRIDDICRSSGVGNPFKCEKIEWKKPVTPTKQSKAA